MQKIHKIVITGGPCAGKSTAMSWIQNAFSQMGYTVLFVPETATELISGGVAPWTLKTNTEYQLCQMQLQLEKEKVFLRAAQCMKQEKVLIVCDRGAMDNRAYMTDAEFAEVLAQMKANEVELRDSYGAVFHLTTAAKGASTSKIVSGIPRNAVVSNAERASTGSPFSLQNATAASGAISVKSPFRATE